MLEADKQLSGSTTAITSKYVAQASTSQQPVEEAKTVTTTTTAKVTINEPVVVKTTETVVNTVNRDTVKTVCSSAPADDVAVVESNQNADLQFTVHNEAAAKNSSAIDESQAKATKK